MKLLTIIGPTASGKTALAIKIAQQIHGEIISADSKQIYRYMAIGTAQPTAEQRRIVPFHLIDFIDPDADYSCGQFARDAETIMGEIISRNHTPIVCGGTGLYIKALYDPLHPLPESDHAIKRRLMRMINEEGMESLHARLLQVDPTWATKVGPHDRQRIMRGLEVYELTGTPLSVLISEQKRRPRYDPLYVGLHLPRTELHERIDNRFDTMIEQGLLKEVQALLKKNFDPECNALRTIGYREIIDHLRGTTPIANAIAQAKQHTRQFAKRQLTWFRRLSHVQWFDPRDKDLAVHIAGRARAAFSE
ncbi:tRNA (adenosine(37)-N6)-dimethylallyltransferase MiaA [candidate division WOR-3 bacterium]|nr:tRNA (adenosine(37)-N6)-dimethylallyltransferase MiaA [candidate division WOR-3 bacterium]